jgi:hypothetical protein
MESKQANMANTETLHPSNPEGNPNKSKKASGLPETAKEPGTVDPTRPNSKAPHSLRSEYAADMTRINYNYRLDLAIARRPELRMLTGHSTRLSRSIATAAAIDLKPIRCTVHSTTMCLSTTRLRAEILTYTEEPSALHISYLDGLRHL